MAQVTLDFYELLKKSGGLLQNSLNTMIQNKLNTKAPIKLAGPQPARIAEKIRKAQNYVESTSTIINFPTKKDLSNATQLIMQSEEKIDQLDEQLYELTKMLQEMQQTIVNTSSPTDQTQTMITSAQLENSFAIQEEKVNKLLLEINEIKQIINNSNNMNKSVE